MNTTFIRLFLAALITSMHLVAASAQVSSGEKGTFAFRALLATPSDVEREFWIVPMPIPEKPVKSAFRVASGGVSQKYFANSKSFKIASINGANGALTFLAEVTLAKATGTTLLLLSPGKDGLDVIQVDSESSQFKGGSTLFVNLTETLIGGEFNRSPFRLDPKKPVFLQEPQRGDLPYYQVNFYTVNENKLPSPLASTRWPHDAQPSSRLIALFHSSKGSGVHYSCVRQFLNEAE